MTSAENNQGLPALPQLPKGFRFFPAEIGMRSDGGADVLAITCKEKGAHAAGVFTQNAFAAAPVRWSQRVLSAQEAVRGVLINAVVANAATGRRGEQDAAATAQLFAKEIGASPDQILLASTGKIGPFLPVSLFQKNLPNALKSPPSANAADIARAIITTDTAEKYTSERCGEGTVLGIAKGSGMIAPNMATMIAVLATDALPESGPAALPRMLARVCEQTFNAITIDGCESTNDTVFLLCSGAAGTVPDSVFEAAIANTAQTLAEQIVRDGEGATIALRVEIRGAKTPETARRVAQAIANSPLVKTAAHGADPNFGRILSAAGSVLGAQDSAENAQLFLNHQLVFSGGAPTETPIKLQRGADLHIMLDLQNGPHTATALGCDLSKEYVDINAEYST